MTIREEETFVEAFRDGRATEKDLLDEIDRWHCGAGGKVSLATFLGMTWPQYKAWAEGVDLEYVLSLELNGGP